MPAYYNEIDPYCAQWLRNLIAKNLIAPGDVDERSIVDVRGDDLRGYGQCHFFAGIGGWSLALRLAGVADNAKVWTGSCPCQPLSGAGLRKGHADERHLWPAFHRLISECAPPVVFGEQVASKDGREWLAGVRADLEHLGYACGGADLCAAGVGAPHIRQRLYWVAQSLHAERWKISGPVQNERDRQDAGWQEAYGELGACREIRGGLADSQSRGGFPRRGGRTCICGSWIHATENQKWENAGQIDLRHDTEHCGICNSPLQGRLADSGGRSGERRAGGVSGAQAEGSRSREQHGDLPLGLADGSEDGGRLGDASSDRRQRRGESKYAGEQGAYRLQLDGPGARRPWDGAIWLPCADGKARRIESSVIPLVDGAAFKLGSGSSLEGKSRVGMLRAYGNCIVPQVAATFVSAFMECEP